MQYIKQEFELQCFHKIRLLQTKTLKSRIVMNAFVYYNLSKTVQLPLIKDTR